MEILAILISGAVSMGFFYKMFYQPTHMERNTALGIVLTEEGIQSEEVRDIVRQYRAMQREVFLASASIIVLGLIAAWFAGKMGILLEIFRLLLTWEMFFYLHQKYQRKIILLKYDNHWLEETTKHMCYMKMHMNRYSRELVNDLAFIPVFLFSFRAFFYPGVKEYLQGNLVHGLVFIVPFMILLVILWVYYSGKINRNLAFFFAYIELVAMWIFQWKLIMGGVGLPAAIAIYVLLLLTGIIALIPYVRGVLVDKELAQKNFPERMPTDGEEVWLYGYYRNKKDKSLWVKRKNGAGISLNRANSKARLILGLLWIIVYSGITIFVACLF